MKSFFLRTLRLFLKQTLTALLFSALMLGMQTTEKAPFPSYAKALGQALRFESDLSPLENLTRQLTDQVRDRL
ncbi:MAG: hypothetical protein IKW60_05950 [Clostridia bacterium]|nr:hypothetical protein [Clostridia bacterium]